MTEQTLMVDPHLRRIIAAQHRIAAATILTRVDLNQDQRATAHAYYTERAEILDPPAKVTHHG